MPEIALRIGDTDWHGWTAAEITLTMDAVAGAFSIGLTEKWPGITSERPIKPGEPCTLTLDGEPVVTGYVDVVMPFYTEEEHAVNVTGRDATGQLFDCSAEGGPWRGLALPALATEIARPFGIRVISELGDPGPAIEQFQIQPGERAWAAIDRAAKASATLGMSDGKGNLVLTRAATTGQTLPVILGGPDGNVLKGTGIFSASDTYSHYVIKAQRGGLIGSPEDRAHVMAEAADNTVGRERTLVIVARDRMDQRSAAAQVQWEANVRRGRAERAAYTLSGWRNSTGALWRPNTLAGVRDEWLRINKAMLIVSVRLTVNEDDGLLVDLDLADPSAYLPAPPSADKKAETGW